MIEPEAMPREREDAQEGDADLIRGLRGGRPEAYAALRRRLGRGLYQYASARLLGDAQVAEDLTVRVLGDAVMRIDSYDARRGSLGTWIYGIMRRELQRELTSRKRRKAIPAWAQVSLEAVADDLADADVTAGLVHRIDAQRQVAELAGALSDLEFEVLVLSCAQELSAGEIARLIGRSERAVHSLLHRARQKARKRLSDDGR